jgi:hypothetical protein
MHNDTATAQGQARGGYAGINEADPVDVTSYDSFPASDPPSWIPTGIGSWAIPRRAFVDCSTSHGRSGT